MDRIESREDSIGMNEKTQAKAKAEAFHGGDIIIIAVISAIVLNIKDQERL